MEDFKNIDQASVKWNVNPLILERWCVDKKIEAIFTDNLWLINVEQSCPLLRFDEHLVYLLDKVVDEFNNLGASIIYYNDIYVYTDLIARNYIDGDAVILTKDIITRINTTELAKLCYIQYLFNYKEENSCYPIFLKFPTLKTVLF